MWSWLFDFFGRITWTFVSSPLLRFLLHFYSCVLATLFIVLWSFGLSPFYISSFLVGFCMCHKTETATAEIEIVFSAGNKFDLHTLMRCHAHHSGQTWVTYAAPRAPLGICVLTMPHKSKSQNYRNRKVSGSCKLLGSWHRIAVAPKIYFFWTGLWESLSI